MPTLYQVQQRGGRFRSLKLLLLQLAKLTGLFHLSQLITRRAVRIICYHGVWLGGSAFAGDAMFMSARTFERRLDTIVRLGYPTITLTQAAAAIHGKTTLPACPVVITIDDGWYGTYSAMLPALRERDLPATLYCDTAHLLAGLPIAHVMAEYLMLLADPGHENAAALAAYEVATDRSLPLADRVAAVRDIALALDLDFEEFVRNRVFHYMSIEEMRQAAQAGLDVQLHTHNHTLHDLSDEMLAREIDDNRRALSDILSRTPESFRNFCYPSGICSAAVADAAERLGLSSSTTTRHGIAWPGSHRQLLPRIIDGEHMSDIEFEAELSGFGELARPFRRVVERMMFVLDTIPRLEA